jgi:hypothetical protein
VPSLDPAGVEVRALSPQPGIEGGPVLAVRIARAGQCENTGSGQIDIGQRLQHRHRTDQDRAEDQAGIQGHDGGGEVRTVGIAEEGDPATIQSVAGDRTF